MNEFKNLSRYENSYYSKNLMERPATLWLKCKVISSKFYSVEIGHSTSLNIKSNFKFMFSNCLIQCSYAHKSKGGESFPEIEVLDYIFEYQTYDNRYKYKSIIKNNKRYTQTYYQKNNRYYQLKNSRLESNYIRKSKMNKLSNELK